MSTGHALWAELTTYMATEHVCLRAVRDVAAAAIEVLANPVPRIARTSERIGPQSRVPRTGHPAGS